MRTPGDVLSYLEMCQDEGVNLQQGMNFRLRGGTSVILMSVRAGAPYATRDSIAWRPKGTEARNLSRGQPGP